MARVITSELSIACPGAKLLRLVLNARRWIVFVARSCQMQYRHVRFFISQVRFPVAWQTTTNSNHPTQHIRMSKGEAIIQCARLREPQQESSFRIDNPFVCERVDDFKERLVMNGNRFFRMKIRQPSEAIA